MNESSSYKHLTVILAALLTTIVIAIIALVLLLSATPADSPSGDSTEDKVTSFDRNDPTGTTSNKPNDQTTPSSNVTTAPSPTASAPPATTPPNTSPTVTTPPPVTDPPIVAPSGPINGSAYGDQLGSLGLYAEWNTVVYDPATGNCTLKLSVYCDSYSISIGARYGNYLVINDQRVEFRTEKLSVPTNDYKARTLLYSTEYVVEKGSPDEALPVHVEFGWHYQGKYSGEYAEWLTLTTDFVV